MQSNTFLLFGILFIFNFQLGHAQAKKLKIEYIGVGQTKIWDIGSACRVSLNQGEDWIKDVSAATKIPVNITRIDEEDYNIDFIRSYLQDLKFKDPDNTIVIFYGTGHGFNYEENVMKYPVFAVHPDRKQLSAAEFDAFRLSLQKDVHEVLLNKGARFVFTVGELCNGIEKPSRTRPLLTDECL